MGLVAATDVASKVLNKAGAHLVRRVERLTGLSADNGGRLLPLFGAGLGAAAPLSLAAPLFGAAPLESSTLVSSKGGLKVES